MREVINEIVGIKDDEVYVLQTVFDNNGFKGATGYSMRPLTRDDIEYYRSAEYLRDFWKQAVQNDQTEEGLDEWVEDTNDEVDMEERLFATDDDSFRDEFLELVDALPEKQKKQVMALTDCTFQVGGCGRHFTKGMQFDVVFNMKLVYLINKYEE